MPTETKLMKGLRFRRPDLPKLLGQSSRYLGHDLRGDAMAGLTVAIMGVPQAMAYALIAGLPPVYGLYTAIVPCIIAATLGSSKHLVTGPTNAMCMVIFSLTASMPQRYDISLIEIVLTLTLLTGLFQFLFGFLQLGKIVKYVSNSVVVGFTAGAGILIASNQFKSLMGVQIPAGEAGHFLVTLWATFSRIHESNPYALATGLATILMLVGFRRWLPKLPGSLITLIVLSGCVWLLGWSDGTPDEGKIRIVRDIDEITSSFDLFRIPQMFLQPNLELLNELVGGALALAILGLVESTSIARGIAASSGQRLNFNKEFSAQGLAKIGGSFFSCFAASGSFTRSAVCYQSGGRTRLAAIFSALFTALILLAFGPLANFIPLASLAGVIVMTAATMVNRERLVMTWSSGSNSRIVMGGTFASTLLMPLEIAIFAGVMLSIVLLLRVTGKPDLTQLVQHPDYGFEEVPFNRAAPSPVAIINLEGDLYFAAAEDLDYELLQALKPETRVVVLRMKRLRAVGSSAMAMLEHFHKLLHNRGITLIVCGIEEEMTTLLTNSGLRKLIGEQNIFYADNRIFQSTELALARAMGIVEMQRSRSEDVAAADQEKTLVVTTAADLMQKRCLRFGFRHQLREAMWLISQFQKRMGTNHPQTVFLQDQDGKLCAELSVQSILRSLASEVPQEGTSNLGNAELARLLEPRLFGSIGEIAHNDPLSVETTSPLVEVFSKAAHHGFRPMPVSDPHGRLAGVFDEMAMLCALTKLLQAEHIHKEGPPQRTTGPEPTIPRT